MNILSDVDDISLAYWGAYLISQHADEAFPEAMLPDVAAFLGRVVRYTSADPSNNVGRQTIFFGTRNTLVLCNGVTNAADGLGWLQGYSVPGLDHAEPQWHRDAVLKGDLLLAQLPDAEAGTTPSCTFFGHSAGGVVAQYCGWKWNRDRSGNDAHVITFGAPRPANLVAVNSMRSIRHIRYFANTDPIPFVPPQASESLEVMILVGREIRDLWREYYQTPNGSMITREGGNFPRRLPPLSDLGPGISAVETVLADAMFSSVDHTISLYVRLLGRYLERPRPPGEPVIPGVVVQRGRGDDTPVPGQVDPTETELRRQVTEAAAARDPGRTRTAPYIVVRKNGYFAVVGNGEPVAYFARRKPASKMASGLNRAYSRWWHASIGQAETLGGNVGQVFSG